MENTGNLNPLEPGLGLLPATDTLGNQTPAAMAAANQPAGGASILANPNEPIRPEGGNLPLSPVSGGATLGAILQAKNSPHISKFASAIKNAIQGNPQAVNKPGALSRLLVGGAIEALGGSIGDAAAADTKESSGALGGIERTMAARSNRMAAQRTQNMELDKSKALVAEANTRMIHEQKLIHQMDEEQIQKSIDSSIPVVDKLKTGASPAPVIADGLTSDELKEYLKSNKIDPTKETAFPTGRKVIGQNADGTPVYRTTYTALGVPPEVKLDPSNDQDKKLLDDMNKYAPPSQGKWGTTGVQTMTGQQYNWVMQQVADNRAKTLARDKTLVDQGLEDKDTVRKREAVTFGGADWTNALSNAPSHDPIAARNAILSNPQLAAKYPNLDSDLRFQYGEKNYDKMLDDYQKKVDAGMEQITDLQKTLDKAHGEEAAGMAETFQSKLDDPNTPPSLKPRYQRMKAQANNQAKASVDFAADKKQKEADAEQRASQGDLSTLHEMVGAYDYDPDKLFSRFKGMKEKQEFIAEQRRQDPTWSEAEYKARYTTKQDFRPEGKGGQAKQSLNTFAGHIGDANSLISSLNNTKSPLLNTPLNKMKEDVLGKPEVIAYRTAIAAAADNYIDFLLNQKAKHQSDDDLAARLQSVNTSPAAAQAMMRQMANTVAVRARALNKGYRDQIKADIPNFLDPDTEQVLNSFGIDPKSITAQGTSGLIKPAVPTAPKGATITYYDKDRNVKGWAVNGKFVGVQ